ncbi:MAG: alpha/beta-hydrolase family protein, partial [Acidimicrobiales bacterium]
MSSSVPVTAIAQALRVSNSVLDSQVGRWLADRFDVLGSPTVPLETSALLDSFLPSLMPRTTVLQGLAAGVNVLSARALVGVIEGVNGRVLGSDPRFVAQLGIRGAELAAGQALAALAEEDGEMLWRAGARSSGVVLRAAAIGGAVYDVGKQIRVMTGGSNRIRPLVSGALVTSGTLVWASRRLAVRRKEIRRWPVVQEATTVGAVSVAVCVTAVGGATARAYRLTGRGLQAYLGSGSSKQLLAKSANAGFWAAGLTALYNAVNAVIGQANEKIEPAYSALPTSNLVSGGPESRSPFAELGQQGRRYVSDVIPPKIIEEVMGEPAVAHPIRTYVGFNTEPLYGTGRAELALSELDRTGAFDRSFLLLISPTGTGWVDQTVIEAAELITRGDIASCAIQYGRFPSFLAVQKVGLGRVQFRLLLWGIRQRLAERDPQNRPKVLVFGESLGAWTSSDVVMDQGIAGFDHYGIDRALWFGLPALAKWSRNGMASGSSDLVPEGVVGIFDSHDQLAELDDEARSRLRAVILSHDNDPIAAVRPELAIQQPDWLRGDRGRNVPADMDWLPFTTFWQVAIDAANAMQTVPGDFRSFGHDYRGESALFVCDAFQLPAATDNQMQRVDEALRSHEMDRKARIRAKSADEAPKPASMPESEF